MTDYSLCLILYSLTEETQLKKSCSSKTAQIPAIDLQVGDQPI